MLKPEPFEFKLEPSPDPVQDDWFHSEHKDDRGERTNPKLRVQPFYQRQRNGKMKSY